MIKYLFFWLSLTISLCFYLMNKFGTVHWFWWHVLSPLEFYLLIGIVRQWYLYRREKKQSAQVITFTDAWAQKRQQMQENKQQKS